MKRGILISFIASIAGLLFSGFLTFQKAFSGTCSLREGCTYIYGYPSCLYGFALFLLLTIFSSMALSGKKMRDYIMTTTVVGILFALYSSIKELSISITGYGLILPSCVYGLIIYIIVFICALRLKK